MYEFLYQSTCNKNLKQHQLHKELYTSSEQHTTGFSLELVKNCTCLLQ